MVVDFKRNAAPPTPIMLGETQVASVESCRFLGVTITQDLKWEPNIMALLKKAHMRMYFFWQFKKLGLPDR